ncbi:DUF2501 domain-containing protein [Halomonas sp. WWR20]
MNIRCVHLVVLSVTLALTPTVSAQSLDSLREKAGNALSGYGASASGSSLLSALGSGSFELASMRNVAGVLSYCQQQGYTASATERIKDKLLGQMGGQEQASQDSVYQQGLSGILQGGDGKSFNLSGLKDQVGERACNAVADQAMSSFLGG